MNRPDEDLLARYLEGELAPGEETALLDLLRRDPRAAEQLEAFLRLDEGLREAMVPEASGDALVRAVAERLAKHGGTDVFARQVVQQIAAAEKSGRKKTRWIRILRPHGRSSGAWTLPLIAAAALFAILILAAVASQPKGRPVRPDSRNSAVAPAPAPLPEPDLPAPPTRRNPAELQKEVAALEQERRDVEQRREQALKQAEDARRGELLRQAEAELAAVAARHRAKVEELEQAKQAVARTSTSPTVASAAAVAQVQRVKGDVLLQGSPARSGQDLIPGQGVETSAQGSASIAFADETRIDLGGATRVVEAGGPRGKRLDVAVGTVTAEVRRQPAGQLLVFETPHARAEVLGTTLRLVVDAGSTRLEVKEGRVRFVPNEGAPVEVGADQFATAGAGMKTALRPMPIDEIVLLPDQVRTSGPEGWGVRVLRPREAVLKGTDWRRVQDRDSIGGLALEAPLIWNGMDTGVRSKSKRLMQSWVEFVFPADEAKDYHVWVHGRSTARSTAAPGQEWYRFDFVALDPVNAEATSSHLPLIEGGRAYEFNGFGQFDRYWWVSGNADPGDPAMPRGTPANPPPLTIRFKKTGPQVLRIYPIETPMRIDAVWLSATQKTRPADEHPGLEVPKK